MFHFFEVILPQLLPLFIISLISQSPRQHITLNPMLTKIARSNVISFKKEIVIKAVKILHLSILLPVLLNFSPSNSTKRYKMRQNYIIDKMF